ncbi:hypothetical protein [Arsenicicoccus sp. oral taxon 190]|uniref:hypothetical protein n=1 Tax=Arsenicicoccus sp. oral taxon 190 TaxID=1658671 RepID=UPI00209D94E4|nr:hypothetical protein [Arsenicicoccus sp. oral taxon 190]
MPPVEHDVGAGERRTGSRQHQRCDARAVHDRDLDEPVAVQRGQLPGDLVVVRPAHDLDAHVSSSGRPGRAAP